MEYQPKELGESAEASSGGGPGGMLREFALLGMFSAVVIAVVWLSAGGLANIATRMISPEQESEWLATLLPDLDVWSPSDEKDAETVAMLNHVLKTLASRPDVPPMEFRIVLIDDPAPNAFAMPGGVIGVTRGLVRTLGRDEIAHAFVIGHELGHFRNRDHLRGFIRKLGAGGALSVIFSSTDAIGIAGNVGKLLELDYSRTQEEAADAFGLQLVRSAYGETAGSERLFEKLHEGSGLPAWAYMFTTHPDPASRIEKIRKAASHGRGETDRR